MKRICTGFLLWFTLSPIVEILLSPYKMAWKENVQGSRLESPTLSCKLL